MIASSLLPTTNFTKSLSTLDISGNNLPSASIYPWLFNSSESLTDIDLSYNMLLGTFPKAFSEFRSLQNLYLTDNGLTGGIPRSLGNFSNLCSLRLDVNNLKVNLLTLFQILAPLKKSIQVLKLSSNKISGSFPDFTSFSALRELHINDNEITGSFPEKFEQTSNLFILNLADNHMSGLLPNLSALSSLRELYLDRNRFKGTLAERIMPLSELQSLGVSSNHLHGTISENHLTNLSNLVYLDLSYNSFVLEIDTDWSPAFSLDVMSLSSCNLGPSFPTWLRTQKNFSMLDISDAKINDFVPDWFWKQLKPNLRYLNLSSNQIHGTLPDLMYGYRSYFDFSSNNFSGLAPLFPTDTQALVLNNNMFSGSISFLQNLTETFNIDLSNNQFFGEIPDFWTNFINLMYLNLKNNNLEGRIPKSMGTLSLSMLSMSNNRLTGELYFSLTNWSSLQFLDLGGNKLSGRIPAGIGRSLSELRFLSLSFNVFHGTMPTSLCRLSNLQILDISSNNISGTIPKCLNSLKAMTQIKTLTLMVSNDVGMNRIPMLPVPLFRYVFKALLQWKGMKHEYSKTLGLVTSLDLSSNRFNGEIPGEITNLLGLVALNLSRNNLTWKIPHDIGRLRRLDFLDMSRNHLTGGIPKSLASLTNLGVLDLSKNNLSGRIPTSTQLQSFDNSSYIRNPSLCGLPLSIPCPGDLVPTQHPRTTVHTDDVGDQDKLITRGFFISLLIGIAFGFWGVCGTLVVSTAWRYAYISFLSHVKDWIYVMIAVNCAKFERRFLA
ncbi:putative leucine-rich repeat protein [Tanacetum coccineum]